MPSKNTKRKFSEEKRAKGNPNYKKKFVEVSTSSGRISCSKPNFTELDKQKPGFPEPHFIEGGIKLQENTKYAGTGIAGSVANEDFGPLEPGFNQEAYTKSLKTIEKEIEIDYRQAETKARIDALFGRVLNSLQSYSLKPISSDVINEILEEIIYEVNYAPKTGNLTLLRAEQLNKVFNDSVQTTEFINQAISHSFKDGLSSALKAALGLGFAIAEKLYTE